MPPLPPPTLRTLRTLTSGGGKNGGRQFLPFPGFSLKFCGFVFVEEKMKKIISSPNAPAAIGPYSQAVEANGTVYVSGQLPVDVKTGKFVEGGIKEQTEQSLKNIGEILKAAGCSYENVVKTTVLLSDMNNFKDMNEVYAKFFTSECPARAAFQVVKLPLGAMVEIECIAVK